MADKNEWVSKYLVLTMIGGEDCFRLRTYDGPSTEFMRVDAGRSAGQGQGDDADDHLHCGYIPVEQRTDL